MSGKATSKQRRLLLQRLGVGAAWVGSTPLTCADAETLTAGRVKVTGWAENTGTRKVLGVQRAETGRREAAQLATCRGTIRWMVEQLAVRMAI